MIELHPGAPGCPRTRLILRPPRVLSGRQLGVLFAVLTGTMWMVALLSAVQGNVFAPPFALLDSLIVASALRWMWRLGERSEQIDVDGTTVCVRRLSGQATDGIATVGVPTGEPVGEQVFRAHPCWVRLSVGSSGHEPHVLLDSRGVRVEVGGFLAPYERTVLAERLQDVLLAASGRAAVAKSNDATN